MKNKQLQVLIVLLLSVLSVQGQTLFVPSGTNGIGISNNGNVGIGTSSPSNKLTIQDGFVESALSTQPGQGSALAGFYLTSVKTNWATFIAAPDGGWGVGPQNYEIWEYPKDIAGGDCCRRRFVMENSYGTTSAGLFYINASGYLGIGLAPTATLDLVRGSSSGGTACLRGTNRNTHFNYSTSEDTYIRGGKPTSNVILNDDGGNVLIGKSGQTSSELKFKLDVAGPIRADEIVVNTSGADFVFEPTYKLRTLSELEAFIKANKHLPEIASAREMEENGVSMGEMQTKLLQKQEETLLYLIEQSKQIEALKKENELLLKRIEQLENTTESKAK